MPSTVRLQNGGWFNTDEEPQALADRFDAARSDGTLVKVDTKNSQMWVNPHVLLTIAPRRSGRALFS